MAPKQVTLRSLNYLHALLLSCACLFLILSAPRSEAAVRFDVFVGYDSILPERGLFPITCELQNDGPAFNAVIEVRTEQLGQGQTRRVELDLPTGSLKRVVIPVFSSANSWDVVLLDEHGKIRAEQSSLVAKVLPPDLPLVAGLCRTVQGLPVFPDMPARFRGASAATYGAARLTAALFPDNPLAMESIDVLYLNSEKALELSLPQVTALKAWLDHGGHLVVGVEQSSDIAGNPWLQDLLPCDLNSSLNLADHQSLDNWVGAQWQANPIQQRPNNPGQRGIVNHPPSSPAVVADDPVFDAAQLPIVSGTMRDGTVLIGNDAAPLAVTAPRGRGRITVLTFSPEREPFISWKDRGFFWARLAGIPRERLDIEPDVAGMARMGTDGIFGAMIDSKQVRKLPLSWLLLLLAAYLAVIGPLDQYWLKKINRQMLTWVTFPFYVVAFSGLIYLIGFHLRAGELEWNELNVVDVMPDQDRAVLRGETYVSIYSPVNGHYHMSSSQPYATLRGEAAGMYGVQQENSHVAVTQIGNTFEAEAFVPVWTSQLFISDWLQGSPQTPLTFAATKQDTGWSVTVGNQTERKLTHLHVVVGGRFYDLADLAPLHTNTIVLNAGDGVPVNTFAGQYVDSFRNAASLRRQSFGNNATPIENIEEGSMAVSFLPEASFDAQGWNNFAVFRSLALSRFVGKDHAILLAWDADHSFADPLYPSPIQRMHRNTLLRMVIPTTGPNL